MRNIKGTLEVSPHDLAVVLGSEVYLDFSLASYLERKS
jgi:hypothetical protein